MGVLSNDYDIQLPSIADRYDIEISEPATRTNRKRVQQFVHRLSKIYEINEDQLRLILQDHFPISKYHIQLHFTQTIDDKQNNKEYRSLTFDIYQNNKYFPICSIHIRIKRYECSIYY